MSDPKRATLITVGAPKSAKNNVNKTVRLTINLDESNESKYPELNYKELVIAEEFQRKKKIENGKTAGLDPFSDNDDDVERVARKFEQKYGGKSTYGRKGRSKHDEFADIGAGYDENDSFIDNTHGYDEMIPPECDTFYGGFYINCGSLEFKSVPENQAAISDAEANGNRRNKRRISSSSSEEESSDSSSECESQEEKDPAAIANGAVDSHKTEHRKKKNKKHDKKKAKKIRRNDSSAATSGKQTSDDNAHGDGESGDSRSSRSRSHSRSDSLASKPAPSSENAITSDSCSRDVEMKVEVQLPPQVVSVLEGLETAAGKYLADNPGGKDVLAIADEHVARLLQLFDVWCASFVCEVVGWLLQPSGLRRECPDDAEGLVEAARLERALGTWRAAARARRAAWSRAAAALRVSRARLLQRARPPLDSITENHAEPQTTSTSIAQPTTANPQPVTVTTTGVTSATVTTSTVHNNKRKCEDGLDDFDPSQLSHEDREAKILETLHRLKALIDEKKPAMISNYNAECERVQEERKKIQMASAAEGAPLVEKRLPKRRFPWCGRARALLARLARLAPPGQAAAALLLAKRALPLFPNGFVRMPTLLRQADLSKELKVSDVKRQRLGSASQLAPLPVQFTEPIQFPSSLTVTTTLKQSPDKSEVAVSTEDKPYKSNTVFGTIMNSFSLSKELTVEKPDKKNSEKVKEDLYIPPNNIGSITITPVPNNPPKQEKKLNNNVQVSTEKQSGFIRVKSPAALNEMVKKDKIKKPEKISVREKQIDTPLHVDTSYQPSKKDPSPKTKEEIPMKKIESMRVSENNIPRPALIPVHHSPTFAKPDKRPPEVKKKKEIVIVSDVDPLAGDLQEPVAIDDSSSDVEVVEDIRTDKSEPKRDKCETVPSKDRANVENNKKVNKVKCKSGKERENREGEESTNEDIDILMKNIREMEHSQEPTKFNSNSFSGITSAKHEKSSNVSYQRSAVYGDSRADKDKLTERTSLNKMDGCNAITG